MTAILNFKMSAILNRADRSNNKKSPAAKINSQNYTMPYTINTFRVAVLSRRQVQNVEKFWNFVTIFEINKKSPAAKINSQKYTTPYTINTFRAAVVSIRRVQNVTKC